MPPPWRKNIFGDAAAEWLEVMDDDDDADGRKAVRRMPDNIPAPPTDRPELRQRPLLPFQQGVNWTGGAGRLVNAGVVAPADGEPMPGTAGRNSFIQFEIRDGAGPHYPQPGVRPDQGHIPTLFRCGQPVSNQSQSALSAGRRFLRNRV